MTMKISETGLALIKRFEGLRLTAYQCAAGVWTIGYGHTGGVKKGQTITQAQAAAYLEADVAKFEKAVNAMNRDFTQNQFDALVSFAFNCGENNLTTLCKDRTAAEIADALLLYNKAGGQVNAGLVARRKAERELFLTDMEVTHDMDTLRKGDKGQQVYCLQLALNHAIGTSLTCDGIFGPKTELAVQTAQKKYGLTVDLIVGPKTWGKLLAV